MNLKRQLLLVSLLTLVLPWAGYRFVRATELALRDDQQQDLARTAQLLAESLANNADAFPDTDNAAADHAATDQLYGHPLAMRPEIDGYFDDWPIDRVSLRSLRAGQGEIRYAIGVHGRSVFLYVEVPDRHVVYKAPGALALDGGPDYADQVMLVSTVPPYRRAVLTFAAEAPGPILTYVRNDLVMAPEPTILAHWQDVPGGYHLEARIPAAELGTHLGLVVHDTASESAAPYVFATFWLPEPGRFVQPSAEIAGLAAAMVPAGMRLLVTDAAGWRIAQAGDLSSDTASQPGPGWLRVAYDALVDAGERAASAEPDPGGREQQAYVREALAGEGRESWFRSPVSGRAVVAAAQPVIADGTPVGAVILQQGTDAILSLTNRGLTRLINTTLAATLLVAAALLGYATWLSRRIRRLSTAAEAALERDDPRVTLPSGGAGDEIGDLSRSFSHVLNQLGDYNAYLRTLASKLSHELRTPLAIVTSSLENLEHEPLNESAKGYAVRARDGADRLRRILTAMSEASRVEELMQHADPEPFDIVGVVGSAVEAYRDVYPQRTFDFDASLETGDMHGAPELLVQMLDKLVDNAVDFSPAGATISIAIDAADGLLRLTVTNPGPPLPEKMRARLFDSMVSLRADDDGRHLGLGLYVAKLIAEGHGGTIAAENIDGGVAFVISLKGETHVQ